MVIEKVKSIMNSKTAKNGMWLYGLQFFNTIIPLMTVPYITRILGASKYGVFSIALNIMTYLQVIVEYGFALSATRKIVLMENEKDINKLFTEVISCRLILYFMTLIFTIIYIQCNSFSVEENICLLILDGSLIGYCFQENWLFQGKQEMKFISIPNIIARSLSTIGIFLYVKNENDIYLYCILYSLSPVISNLIGTCIAVYRYKVKIVKITFANMWDTLRDGVYIFFTQLSSKVFGAIGITFLGIFASEYDVGIYSALNKVSYILMLMWSPIAQIIYPYSSKKMAASMKEGIKEIKRIWRFTFAFFSVIVLIICLFAKSVINILFGSDYVTASYIIYPQLLWVLCGINNNFLGIQIMVSAGFDKEYSKCFQIGVVGTIIFNLVLIYRWGINGAAIAPMISEIVLSGILVLQIQKIKAYKNGGRCI